MDDRDSGAADRAETRAAKLAEREQNAATVWAEVEAKQQSVEKRTAELRAARLAREAQAKDDTPEGSARQAKR